MLIQPKLTLRIIEHIQDNYPTRSPRSKKPNTEDFLIELLNIISTRKNDRVWPNVTFDSDSETITIRVVGLGKYVCTRYSVSFQHRI